MANPEVFPIQHELVTAAHNSIAQLLSCSVQQVDLCFLGLGIVPYDTPEHLEAVGKVTHAFNEAARHAANLTRAINRMTEAQRRELVVAGCVTNYQIEHLADVLAQDAESLKQWSRTRIRTGGRNLAAHSVALAMRRLFRRLRREITFGQHPGGGPSTDFGKAVEFAIGAFGLKANWRRPAQEARDVQSTIIQRYNRIKACRKKDPPLIKPDNLLISIDTVGKVRQVSLSLSDRPDVGVHHVCACQFKSGREISDYAVRWAEEVNAKSSG